MSSNFTIGTVGRFLKALKDYERSREVVLFFRGHKDESFNLQPAIYREPEWIENEDVMFKELVLRCPSDLPEHSSTFQTLVKMQHYSLPTRLLDITTNPLIALYFACDSASHKPQEKGKRSRLVDGEVLVFSVPKSEIKYYDSDTVSVIANLSRRPISLTLPPDGNTFNQEKEIKWLLHEVKKEKPYFEPEIKRLHLESVVCVKPKLDNPRIIRQDGAFFLFGINGSKATPATVPGSYFPTTIARLIVKAGSKSKIREQLADMGVSQATIFPEIEKVAEHIKSIYGPPSGENQRKAAS